ncbi:hypothetical protein SAMN05421743_11971 [Thalassobacillus cyri]|uniref:Uncharacterized protein n=1 Tax=Thalassobacillus cyri TaxID=571932 RepID=A0A1H4GWX8_9BACI|nr:hypothetical protein [Thalassobacillus cyri]SEB14024.1 hypothetical protein SAMN05421743_11971 [Thalassobacillus cyri]
MTGTAVLLDHGNKYIVLEEVERSQIDPALSVSDYPAVDVQNESNYKAISLVGFKEEEIDWEYGY